MTSRWAVSIVSHGHGASAGRALLDIHTQLGDADHDLTLTLNAGEPADFLDNLPVSLRNRLCVIRNRQPRGFGANHNAALRDTEADFVLIADPDLTIQAPVFDQIASILRQQDCGVVSPLAVCPSGLPEDNGRPVVTPSRLLKRLWSGRDADRCQAGRGTIEVDWLAGLFLAMRAETFARLGGFDERYHLYCEDIDLCLRARAQGLRVLLLTDLQITHPARRRTLKNLRHLIWHISSMLMLWRSAAYRSAINKVAPPP